MASKQLQEMIDSKKLPVGTKLIHKARGGKVVRGTVTEDGIKVSKRVYASPSAAASAITGHAMNGWTFWMLEDGQTLDSLR